MSIQNFGTTIRLARKAAGLTQEKLSEGICAVTLLSQIENGVCGVSASIFEALMTRAGKSTKAIPCFLNRTDFDCFYSLKRAHFYISHWQLQKAYNELNFVESHHWADNKFHYAEWLLLHAKIQFYSGNCNHEHNHRLLLHCLSITNPNLSVLNLSTHLLSLNEIEALILLAHEYLYEEKASLCCDICLYLKQYLTECAFSHMDKSRLLAETNIILIKYYLSVSNYEEALFLAECARRDAVQLHMDMPLLQLTFLHAICLYHANDTDNAIHLMKVALYSAHAIGSCYVTVCTKYIRSCLTDLNLENIFPLEDIPLYQFKQIESVEHASFLDGTFPIHSSDILSIGKLIRQLRTEQKITLETLSKGLCAKTKLHKIEKDEQQADILLLEALLQRLGISERPFSFWGNEAQNSFHNLKFKAIHSQQLNQHDLEKYIAEMEALTSTKDVLQKQFILLRKAILCTTNEEKLTLLFDALHCTLPDFDINHIHEYRLSWAELSCLNNIARIYSKTNTPLESFRYFSQLCNYYEAATPDVLFRSSTYALTCNMYCHGLYTQKRFHDIVHLFGNSRMNLADLPMNSLASFLFYYCQALGECGYLESANLFGHYACAMEYLMFLDQNAEKIRKCLHNDFSISLKI